MRSQEGIVSDVFTTADDNPVVSIIIPAYNSAATIVEALESVLAQSLWDMGRETLDVRRQTLARKKSKSSFLSTNV